MTGLNGGPVFDGLVDNIVLKLYFNTKIMVPEF